MTLRTGRLLYALSGWIDGYPPNRERDPEALLYHRVCKVTEECGEAVAALIAATGQNPRKGRSATLAGVEKELLDVAVAALAAIAHLHADDPEPPELEELLAAHVEGVAERVGLEVSARPPGR